LLVGLLRPDAGQVSVWGRPAWQAPAAVRSRIGYVSSSHLYPELTVTDHLRWAARLHGCRGREAPRRADDMIDQLGLRRWASKPARTLSTGNRQRLAIATALIHIDLRRIIGERVAGGTSVLVSSHHLDEVARLASVINVMHAGRLVGHLSPDGVDLERQFFRTVAAAAEDRP
jgi:ABC-2 type transport system ATP-binding protein